MVYLTEKGARHVGVAGGRGVWAARGACGRIPPGAGGTGIFAEDCAGPWLRARSAELLAGGRAAEPAAADRGGAGPGRGGATAEGLPPVAVETVAAAAGGLSAPGGSHPGGRAAGA